MLCIASLIILIFAIKNMIINSKSAKKTILTGGGLIIILLLSYFVLASDEVLISYEKYNITSSDIEHGWNGTMVILYPLCFSCGFHHC